MGEKKTTTSSEGPEDPENPEGEESVGRAAGRIGVVTLFSRLLGLAREQLFAAAFGVSLYSDVFVAAFRIPNLLRNLFAEGALAAAFVPTFSGELATRGREAAYRLANLVMTTLAVLLGAFVLLGLLFPEPLVHLISPGFEGEKVDLTVLASRVMMPYLVFVSLAAVCMGMLNAQERFTRAALAPAMFNVVSIAIGALLLVFGVAPKTALLGWSIGTLLGGLAQFLYQLVAMRRLGFRLRPRFDLLLRDKGQRKIAKLMAAAVIGLAATQTNLLVNTIFASQDEGAISYLNYSFRILYLPLGLFGIAAGMITAVRTGKAVAREDLDGVRKAMRQGIRFLLVFTIPSMVGMILVARPLVALLFERGRFLPEDTRNTAIALSLYGAGLLGYSTIRVFVAGYYSLSRPYVPVIGSFAAVGTNLIFNLIAYRHLGFAGLALGTSLGAYVNLCILTLWFHHDYGILEARLTKLFFKVLVAVGAMAFFVHLTVGLVESPSFPSGFGGSILAVLLPIAAGVAVYSLSCRLLRIDEFLAPFRRRRRKGSHVS
jgi:putative peptidoglycan lipid II flippase